MTVGERIKKLREEAGLTRPQLAELSGVPLETIKSYEDAERAVDPSMTRAFKIARALGCSLDDLMREGSTL